MRFCDCREWLPHLWIQWSKYLGGTMEDPWAEAPWFGQREGLPGHRLWALCPNPYAQCLPSSTVMGRRWLKAIKKQGPPPQKSVYVQSQQMDFEENLWQWQPFKIIATKVLSFFLTLEWHLHYPNPVMFWFWFLEGLWIVEMKRLHERWF